MKNIFYMALIGLVSNFVALPLYAQSLVSGNCNDSPGGNIAQLYQLQHGKPVTLHYQPGQQVTLSGDAGGGAALQGHSVVAIEFEPSGKGLGYGVESLSAQDITPLLKSGPNTVRLTAVDTRDTAWITHVTPCSDPTAITTIEAVATPTSMGPAKGAAIITHSIAITETTDSSKEHSVPTTDNVATAREALLARLDDVLVGLSILSILLAFATGSLQRWVVQGGSSLLCYVQMLWQRFQEHERYHATVMLWNRYQQDLRNLLAKSITAGRTRWTALRSQLSIWWNRQF